MANGRSETPPEIAAKPEATPARTLLLVTSIAAAISAAALFWFNPAEHPFYPRCMFHSVTGLDCPGCGGLRAAHQLLHGNVKAAFALNPLLVLALPVAGWFLLRGAVRQMLGRRLPPAEVRIAWLWAAAALVVGFGIFRNLPWRSWLGS